MRSLSAAFRPHHKAGSLVRGEPTNEYADTARPNQRRGVRETGTGGLERLDIGCKCSRDESLTRSDLDLNTFLQPQPIVVPIRPPYFNKP